MWLAAGLVTLWMTFIPCFLWIFAGAPYLESLTARPRIAASLKAITVAVVGVMASLSLWFALNVLFRDFAELTLGPVRLPVPDPSTLDPTAVLCCAVAGLALWWRGLSVPMSLALCVGAALSLGALGM